jgi:hypothetical protein
MSTTNYLIAKAEYDVAAALRADIVSTIRETVPRHEQFDAISRTPEDARYAAARAALFNAEWAMLESSFAGRPDLLAGLPDIMSSPAARARVVADCLLVT